MRGGSHRNHARSFGYVPPAIDSPRARANAVTFLLNCAKIDDLTADWLAHNKRLKLKTAEYLLWQETKRRG